MTEVVMELLELFFVFLDFLGVIELRRPTPPPPAPPPPRDLQPYPFNAPSRRAARTGSRLGEAASGT